LLVIPDIFAQGAVVHGFPDGRWTTARLASVIEGRFGVHYDHDHVGRLMQKLGLREPKSRPVSSSFAAYSGSPYANGVDPIRRDIAPLA
jgi:hypothetical protein